MHPQQVDSTVSSFSSSSPSPLSMTTTSHRVAHLSKKFESSPSTATVNGVGLLSQNDPFVTTTRGTAMKKNVINQNNNTTNKRHTVSYSSSNSAKNKIALFEKQQSNNQSVRSDLTTSKPFSQSFKQKPSNASSSFIQNHSNSSSPKQEVRKTIKSFEDLHQKSSSELPSHHTHNDVKRHFKLNPHSQQDFNKRFHNILHKMENDMQQTDLYKEAMEMHKRKSVMVMTTHTTEDNSSWTDAEENRLQQLLKLLREEAMKQLEKLESMIKQERHSMRLTSSFSQSSPNLVSVKNNKKDSPSMSQNETIPSNVVGNNLKNVHTNLILQKIQHEKKESIEQALQQEKSKDASLSTSSQFQLVGKPLKERPLPETPIFMTSSPFLSSPRKVSSPQRSVPEIETVIEEKRKRLTMNPDHVEALFEW
nr:unnamed protein product [Naegleria fowleri]